MYRIIRIAALFLGYGALGFGTDYAVALVADEPSHRYAGEDGGQVAMDVGSLDMDVDFGGSERCSHETERRVAIGASAAAWLRVDVGSGELRVEGREGLDRVQAVGRVCASDESWLDDLQLTLERDGGDFVLRAHYPERSGRRGWGDDYARIDLVVEVPLGMPLDIDDSSGEMEVTGTGELRIDDSSGSILVYGVNGSVTIEDSSGEIEVRDVTGDVDIDDGSGEIDVTNVDGSVRLQDGSGSINVRDVRGDFQVRSDGSGGIRYSGVDGTVDVPRKKGRR